MSKLYSRISILLFLFIYLTSCGADQREKDEEATLECLSKKAEDEKFKSIEEALASFDFVVARKYLSCYPNRNYYNGEIDESPSRDNENNLYKVNFKKIVKAEIASCLKKNDYNRARNVANESGMIDEFELVVPDFLNGLIEANNFDKVFSILLSWKFKHDFFESGEPDYGYGNGNKDYNIEVQSYNDLVDNVFNAAFINGNILVMKNCLPLYVPVAVTNPKKSEKVKSVLRNDSKTEAMKKMSEAGFALK